jgi:hypothetical protein
MRPLAIIRRTSTWLTLTVLVMVLALALIQVVAATLSAWSAPHMGPRAYSGALLEEVIQDLEQDGLIPNGTQWPESVCRARRVTARWLLIRDTAALNMIGRSANVTFEYPISPDGEISGPVRVLSAWPGRGGMRPASRDSRPHARAQLRAAMSGTEASSHE